jgi:hypothetical protein
MDIPGLRSRGWDMSFFSGTSIVSPAYYEEAGSGRLRNFYAGCVLAAALPECPQPVLL